MKVLKILSILCLTFILVITFLLGQGPLIEGKHLFDPYIDTQFAENYSPDKFDKIKIGMTIFEANKLIGKPLYSEQGNKDPLNTIYDYTGDGKLLNLSIVQNGYDDFAWYRSRIEVDRNNIIVYIDKGWSHD